MTQTLILKFSCPDQPGIAASVLTFFANKNHNIAESSQYEDKSTQRFFMRTVFSATDDKALTLDELRAQFAPLAKSYDMEWSIRDAAIKPRIMIAVSKGDHCLDGLLSSWRRGVLPAEIVGVVSNHEDLRYMTNLYGVPFYHFPITKETKPAQEAQILACMDEHKAELLVLARYMQILSDDMCQKISGRAINIHHSFLPGFKGAKPYHQAFERGVKLIGATAHYVTADLDEGPIIEQAVERVSHTNQPEELVEIGRDIERVVLGRAVRWHLEDRVLFNGSKTVVFKR